MPKQSGFLKKQEQIHNQVMKAAGALAKQFMSDTLQITMHKDFGWGYDKQLKLLDAWERRREEYSKAVSPKDPEADVAQEHMDRALEDLISGKQPLIPFAERYPELRKIKYGK